MLSYNKTLKANARNLRANMTDAEQIIWQHVRRKQILGIQFYRQKPIGRYIVDFYAPKAKLVVEIDGAQHVEPENMKKDQQRDLYMQQQGLGVLRFDNGAVLTQLNDVLEKIYRVVEQRMNLPQPLFVKEGSSAVSKMGREMAALLPPLTKGERGGFQTSHSLKLAWADWVWPLL